MSEKQEIKKIIEGKTFCIEAYEDDTYTFSLWNKGVVLWLDNEEIKDIFDAFTNFNFDEFKEEEERNACPF